jgi:hypothetical protein
MHKVIAVRPPFLGWAAWPGDNHQAFKTQHTYIIITIIFLI